MTQTIISLVVGGAMLTFFIAIVSGKIRPWDEGGRGYIAFYGRRAILGRGLNQAPDYDRWKE